MLQAIQSAYFPKSKYLVVLKNPDYSIWTFHRMIASNGNMLQSDSWKFVNDVTDLYNFAII